MNMIYMEQEICLFRLSWVEAAYAETIMEMVRMEKEMNKDLEQRSADQRAQEAFLNASASRKQKDMPVSDATKAQDRFWEEIERYYKSVAMDEDGDRRDELCTIIGCSQDKLAKGKFCRLPAFPGGKAPAHWVPGRELSKTEFTAFLSEMTGLGKSMLNEKVFKASKRPERDSVEKLGEGLPAAKTEDLYMLLGHYPQTEDSFADAKKQLNDLKHERWRGANDEEIGIYLGMSKNMFNDMKTRPVHYSNVLRVNIATGIPGDTEREEKLYHCFGVHRLPEGEADKLVDLCQKIYAKVMPVRRKLYQDGSAEEYASGDFWSSLKTLLKYYDSQYYLDSKGTYRKIKLCGQLFYQGPEKLDLAEAKAIMEA